MNQNNIFQLYYIISTIVILYTIFDFKLKDLPMIIIGVTVLICSII